MPMEFWRDTAHQGWIEFDSMLLERQFVTGKSPKAGRKLQPADVRDSLASHGDQMSRCNSPNRDIVDSDEVRLELREIAIDQNKRNPLLIKLLEFCSGATARRDNQAIQAMPQMLLDHRLFRCRVLHRGRDHQRIATLHHGRRKRLKYLRKERMKQSGHNDPNLTALSGYKSSRREIWPVVQLLRLGLHAVARFLFHAGAIAQDFGDSHPRDIQSLRNVS